MFTPSLRTRTFAAAIRDLGSKRADVRAAAARDLVTAGRDDPATACDALSALLADPQATVRGEAALAIGALAGERGAQYVPALRALFDDADSSVRQYAAIALGQLDVEAARAALEDAHRSGREDVRFQALLAIANVAPARGFTLALEALGEADEWIASEAASQIQALLTRTQGEARFGAAERARAREALRSKLASAAGRVRVCVATALLALGDERGTEPLLRYLRGDESVRASDDVSELRIAAIEALRNAPDGDAVRELLGRLAWRLFASAERDVARAVLAAFGDARAAAWLGEQLRARTPSRRDAGVQLAGIARVESVVPELLELLERDPSGAAVVAEALGAIGDPRAIAALEKHTGAGTEDHVREAVCDALARLRANTAT